MSGFDMMLVAGGVFLFVFFSKIDGTGVDRSIPLMRATQASVFIYISIYMGTHIHTVFLSIYLSVPHMNLIRRLAGKRDHRPQGAVTISYIKAKKKKKKKREGETPDWISREPERIVQVSMNNSSRSRGS